MLLSGNYNVFLESVLFVFFHSRSLNCTFTTDSSKHKGYDFYPCVGFRKYKYHKYTLYIFHHSTTQQQQQHHQISTTMFAICNFSCFIADGYHLTLLLTGYIAGSVTVIQWPQCKGSSPIKHDNLITKTLDGEKFSKLLVLHERSSPVTQWIRLFVSQSYHDRTRLYWIKGQRPVATFTNMV